VKRILVTGCNGYIGSHTVKALAEAGYKVDGIDWNRRSPNDVKKYLNEFMIGDANEFTKAYRYDAVVHLAGYISVEESVKYPLQYFQNNTMGTHWQLHFNGTNGCENFIFASTAAAFNPVSPYAQSKLMAESLVKAMAKNYTIFRFFNVAGNNGEFRQVGDSTHLIRIAAETASGKRDHMKIYGNDWNTRDGTCIRDYVHVSDLVDCIVKAIDNPANSDYECIGSGIGYTVNEVIDVMRDVSGINFKTEYAPRRPGDTAEVLIPPEQKSKYFYGKRTLEQMCESAYKMELK
jgi:UDP-glucose 4-epimerase